MKAQKINRPSFLRRYKYSLLIVFIAFGGLLYALINKPEPAANTQADEQSRQEEKQADAQKQTTADRTKDNAEPVVSPDLSVTINRAGQVGPGQPLNVRATITGTTNGTCEVTLTKNGQQPITKLFPIEFSATTSTCVGADIAMSDLPTSGEWNVEVVAKSDNKVSQPASVRVNLEK